MPQIETILTPALFHLHHKNLDEKQVVVIDILRATTTMVVAYENGAKNVIPVESLEEAFKHKAPGVILAGERNGVKVDAFDLGNSPQEFTRDVVEGKTIVISTTNGTKAIEACAGAKYRYISSFRNFTAMVNQLIENNCDVLLFCAGWKDKFNLEDTIFAGAIVEKLGENGFEINDDASIMARSLWQSAKSDLAGFLANASHVKRFKTLHIESDLEVCLKFDSFGVVVSL